MMFFAMMLVYGAICMALFGLLCAILTVVFAVLNRKRQKRWMKIAATVLGIVAALNLLISGGFLVFTQVY